MHKLTRPLDAPAILGEFGYPEHNWDDDFKSKHKQEVWEKLYEMQGFRCAYCEKYLDPEKKKERHIEHFKRKGLPEYKHLMFEWTNLFGSCCVSDRCGKIKDKHEYNVTDLIKMDEEDPEKFFTFVSTGRVEINQNLSENDKKRAKETLRVFNLDPKRNGVRNERERYINSHKHMIDEMRNLILEFKDDEALDFLEEILNDYYKKIKGIPFETVIKHVLFSNWKSSI